MYIQTHEKVKCSKCGSINNFETVTRKTFEGLATIIRCLSCKHEKVQSVLTTNAADGDVSIYTHKQDEERLF
jgi:uncharacterized Zn finger protein